MSETETKYISQFRPSDEEERIWRILAMRGSDVIGSVYLRTMRECVAIGVVYHLEVQEESRRQGVARGLMLTLERVALLNRMTLILSTVRDDNPASVSLVGSLGYETRDGFNNPKSGADIHLFAKGLGS